MALFVEHISTLSADITSVRKSKVTEWIASQAGFIQALLGSICCRPLQLDDGDVLAAASKVALGDPGVLGADHLAPRAVGVKVFG